MLAIFLITGTFAMNKQVDFLLHADLGYDNSNVVSLRLPYGDASNKLAGLFKNELNGKTGISAVSARSGGVSMTMVTTGGEPFMITQDKIDSNYLPLMKIPLAAGRNFLLHPLPGLYIHTLPVISQWHFPSRVFLQRLR